MRILQIIAFVSCFVYLIAVQIILRKLSILFPVDLTAYATTLAIQFAAAAAGYFIILALPRFFAVLRNPGFTLAMQGLVLISLASGASVIWCAILFFSVTAIFIAALFSVFSDSARTNVFIYSGSAVGLLVAEKVFFHYFGLNHMLLVSGCILILCGVLLAYEVAKNQYMQKSTDQFTLPSSSLLSAFLAGFILFGGLILAYRLLRIYLRDTADVIAEITAISMLVGALVSFRFSKMTQANAIAKFVMLLAAPVFFVLAAQNLQRLVSLPRELFILLLLFPISAWASFIYNEALTRALLPRQTYQVLLFNTLGSFSGALTFGYAIVPAWKLKISLQIFMICFVLTSLLLLLLEQKLISDRRIRRLCAMAMALSAVLGIAPLVSIDWYKNQINALAKRLVPDEKIVASVETAQDLWLLTENTLTENWHYHRLIHNSHSMSGTMFPSRRYMKLMAYLGALHNGGAKSALNIGFGTGLTAQALLENKNLTLVDISDVTREIEQLTRLIFVKENSSDPLKDARVRYHLGGARHFLLNTNQKYDIITGEPPPPSNSSIAYLYTAEFYREVAKHLHQGGTFTYWLPTHSVSDAAAEKIWATFKSVFAQSELYAGTESNLIMVGHQGAARLLHEKHFNPDWSRETNIGSLRELEALRIDPAGLAPAILTDDYSYIEEDFARATKQPWGVPNLHERPQIYVADVTINPFVSLVALEKILPTKPSLNTIRTLLGNGSLAEPLAMFFARADYAGAHRYLIGHQDKIRANEVACAYIILVDRLMGRDENEIKQAAVSYARERGGVSPLFRKFVDRKLPPAYYGN